MFQKLHSIFEKTSQRQKEDRRLVVSDVEVALFRDSVEVWRFHWDDVTRIVTCKWDLFSVDLVCLDFVVESQQLIYQTDEDMQGFWDLCEQMHRLFPSISEGWWSEVVLPPFATNKKVLYDKPAT